MPDYQKTAILDNNIINRFYYTSKDYDEFATMLRDAAHVEEKLLESGSFNGTVSIVSTPNVVVTNFVINKKVLQFGTSTPGYITFTIWEPNVLFSWRKHEMKKGMIGILWKKEHQSVTGSEFKGLPVSVEEDYFIKLCHSKGYPELVKKLINSEVLYVSESHLEKIRRLVRLITQNRNLSNQIVYNLIEQELLDLLIRCIAATLPENTELDLTYPKFASIIDYIHENLCNITSVQQVCENTQVPERTVRRLIRKKYDISPKNFLNNLRLNEVKKGLKKDSIDSHVFQIASEYNFWHMGQFSRDYKRLFGELPSDTLKSYSGNLLKS